MFDDTPAPAPQQTIQPPNSLATGAIVADVLVTIIIITGMIVDKNSVTLSVLSGVAFFAVFGGLVILTLSGTLAHIATNGQNQKTVRQFNQLQYNAQMEHLQNTQRLRVIDRPRLAYTPDVEGLPDNPNFVSAIPPVSTVTSDDAQNFVSQLFDASTGLPLPNRITRTKRQIQYRSPSSQAIDYLMSLGIIGNGQGHQFYYNLTDYPTLLDALHSLRTGVKKGSLVEGTNVYFGRERRSNTNKLSSSKRFRILQRDGFQCQICGKKTTKEDASQLHVDHKIPSSQGGTNDDENLWTLCDQCNMGKSDQMIDELSGATNE